MTSEFCIKAARLRCFSNLRGGAKLRAPGRSTSPFDGAVEKAVPPPEPALAFMAVLLVPRAATL
jgi:hypothetical protein